MTSLLQDFRFSLRLLAKSPGFAAAAITVLALGIGLNTAIFSLTYALAFSPRPFAAPDRIVQLYTRDLKKPDHYRPFSYPLYREIAARQDLFAGVFAHSLAIVGVGEKAGTRRALSTLITANYFDTLGVKLARGRAFTSAEERPGAGLQVAIASYQYWKKKRLRSRARRFHPARQRTPLHHRGHHAGRFFGHNDACRARVVFPAGNL